jgi:hypothetical protein
MHFRDIANEAMKRGYKGRGSKTRSPRLAAQRSFEQTMRGDKSFECVGDGVFRLREGFGTLKGE